MSDLPENAQESFEHGTGLITDVLNFNLPETATSHAAQVSLQLFHVAKNDLECLHDVPVFTSLSAGITGGQHHACLYFLQKKKKNSMHSSVYIHVFLCPTT